MKPFILLAILLFAWGQAFCKTLSKELSLKDRKLESSFPYRIVEIHDVRKTQSTIGYLCSPEKIKHHRLTLERPLDHELADLFENLPFPESDEVELAVRVQHLEVRVSSIASAGMLIHLHMDFFTKKGGQYNLLFRAIVGMKLEGPPKSKKSPFFNRESG